MTCRLWVIVREDNYFKVLSMITQLVWTSMSVKLNHTLTPSKVMNMDVGVVEYYLHILNNSRILSSTSLLLYANLIPYSRQCSGLICSALRTTVHRIANVVKINKHCLTNVPADWNLNYLRASLSHFAHDNFKCISLSDVFVILINISLKYVPGGFNRQCQTGKKPLPETK